MSDTDKIPYVHEITGDVVKVTRGQANFLSPRYKPVKFVRDKDGRPVMRLELKNATVDITETD